MSRKRIGEEQEERRTNKLSRYPDLSPPVRKLVNINLRDFRRQVKLTEALFNIKNISSKQELVKLRDQDIQNTTLDGINVVVVKAIFRDRKTFWNENPKNEYRFEIVILRQLCPCNVVKIMNDRLEREWELYRTTIVKKAVIKIILKVGND